MQGEDRTPAENKMTKESLATFLFLGVTFILFLHSASSDPLQTRQFLKDGDEYTGQKLYPVIIPLRETSSIMKLTYNTTEAVIPNATSFDVDTRGEFMRWILDSDNDVEYHTTMTKTQIAMLEHGCYGYVSHEQAVFFRTFWQKKYWGLRSVLLQHMQLYNTLWKTTYESQGYQSSHEACECFKDFATTTDLRGDISDNERSAWSHEIGPRYTECEVQNLAYEANDDKRGINGYFYLDVHGHNGNWTYAKGRVGDELHWMSNTTIADEPSALALFEAMNLDEIAPNHLFFGVSRSSTLATFLHQLQSIAVSVDQHNMQYAQPSEWIKYTETAAIETCMHHAVPIFVDQIREYISVQVHYKTGEHFLLAAVCIGIYYSCASENNNMPSSIIKFASGALLCLIVFLTLLMLNHSLEVNDSDVFATIFNFDSDVMALVVVAAITFILYAVLVVGVIISIWSAYSKNYSTVLACMMFDICIILGTAHMSLAMATLQGISAATTVLLVFLLLTCVGLIQHFSNLSLIVLQLSNNVVVGPNSVVSDLRVALHRSAMVVLSAIILYVTHALASTTYARNTVDLSAAASSNAIFLLGVFFILTGYDIWHEASVHFTKSTSFADTRHYFCSKHYAVGVLIVALLIILNVNRYLFLCGKWSLATSGDSSVHKPEVCDSIFAYVFGWNSEDGPHSFYGS